MMIPQKKSTPTRRYQIFFFCVIGSFAVIALLFVLTVVLIKPQNKRDWETGFEKLPKISQKGNTIVIQQVRNYRYAPGKQMSFGYTTRTIPIKDIKRVWLVYEPFRIPAIPWFGGVAHTYFVFDIQNQKPLALSVEARREKGETYDAFKGMLPTYELIYVWANEEDITGRRALIEHNTLYMYPLLISPGWAQKLFLQLIHTTHSLETTPRFYNSLWSNCTSELVKNANRVKKGSIPFHPGIYFPGYADKMLYDLGFISHDRSFLETQKAYFITDLVNRYYTDSNFSQRLRKNIPRK